MVQYGQAKATFAQSFMCCSSISRTFRARMRRSQSFEQIKMKNKKVYGLTEKPASAYYFDCKEMGGKVTVEEYFLHKHGLRLEYPHLPCVQVGTATNCVPMEYVYVMGGEHNLEVGKLRQDFQREVSCCIASRPAWDSGDEEDSDATDTAARLDPESTPESRARRDFAGFIDVWWPGPAAALEGKGVPGRMKLS